MKYYQLSFTLDKSVRGKFEMPHTISIESPNFLKYISEKSKKFNCSSLTGVDIPNIYNCVFYDCSSLTCINIPDSATRIWYAAFGGCDNLSPQIKSDIIKRFGEEVFAVEIQKAIVHPEEIHRCGNS